MDRLYAFLIKPCAELPTEGAALMASSSIKPSSPCQLDVSACLHYPGLVPPCLYRVRHLLASTFDQNCSRLSGAARNRPEPFQPAWGNELNVQSGLWVCRSVWMYFEVFKCIQRRSHVFSGTQRRSAAVRRSQKFSEILHIF